MAAKYYRPPPPPLRRTQLRFGGAARVCGWNRFELLNSAGAAASAAALKSASRRIGICSYYLASGRVMILLPLFRSSEPIKIKRRFHNCGLFSRLFFVQFGQIRRLYCVIYTSFHAPCKRICMEPSIPAGVTGFGFSQLPRGFV